jgi:ligand-binding sensor domain-containing protein
MKFLSIAIGCLFLFQTELNSQTYSFKNFGAESDIPNGFVYTLVQADNGFLWVATGNGLSRFDGHNFYSVPYPDSLSSRYTTVSLKDKSGRLWFGCSDGSVYYNSGNKLIAVDVENSKSISDIVEGPDGNIYVIPQGKAVIKINSSSPDEIHKYFFPDDPVLFSASFTSTGSLLIGTQMNLLICDLEKDSVFVKAEVEGFDYSSVTAIHRIGDKSLFLIGTDGNGLFMLRLTNEGNILSRFVDNMEMRSLSVQSVYEDSDNNIWVSTFGYGVIQFTSTDDYENA